MLPTPSPLPGPTAFEVSALAAQWVGSAAALLSVGVAILFGILTLSNRRLAKDNQERSTLTAAAEPVSQSVASLVAEMTRVHWVVLRAGGEEWTLLNDGADAAYDVTIEGLTDLDQRRLTPTPAARSVVMSAGSIPFTLVSRFTLSGPANVVVTYALEPHGTELRKVVQVPAE